jgi:MoxR-like ATPase
MDRAHLALLLEGLERGLVERRQVLRLSLLAALAGEHTLLIGPPGTAKSALARRIHLAFREARYFERLLTRFTVPEELFGPLSIRALEEDRYERHVAGFLPDAEVAFIDEVFKANSAILNALLTLLNEREFDNGAGRVRCPLISVIGATNQVPEDEVAEAFFDRFLLRLTVGPVSADGFRALLAQDVGHDALGAREAGLPARQATSGGGCSAGELALAEGLQLGAVERAALTAATLRVRLPADVLERLAELRTWLAAEQHYVSDRRWVKIGHLLRTAAASEGRAAVAEWDLGLVPCCIAADPAAQQAVSDWLTTRLGIRAAFSPPRLTRVVEAFEAQLKAEREANDLDYDEAGRLRFSAVDAVAQAADVLHEPGTAGQAGALAGAIGDAKGGAAALRMTYARKRRYGRLHIAARTGQIDAVLDRLAACRDELAGRRESLAAWAAQALWADPVFVAAAGANLAGAAAALDALTARACAARAGFETLPRLDADGARPPAVEHETLPD